MYGENISKKYTRIRKLESYENLPPGLDKKVVIPEKEPIFSKSEILQSVGKPKAKQSTDKMVDDFLEGVNRNAEQLNVEVDLAKNFNKTIPDRNICPVCFHEVKEKYHPICGFCSHELEGKL